MSRIAPVNDNIILKEVTEAENVTAGGIVLPNKIKGAQNTKTYRVLAAGPGMLLQDGSRAEMTVKKGDIVLVDGSRGGNGFMLDGELLFTCRENAIVGVKEPDVVVQ